MKPEPRVVTRRVAGSVSVHIVVMYTHADTETRAGFKADGAWDSWPEAAGCLAAAQGLLHEEWRKGGDG